MKDALREAFCTMDFDTTTFSVAMIYMHALEETELKELIERRRALLLEYLTGIDVNINNMKPYVEPHIVIDVERMKRIIEVELETLDSLA